MYMLSISVYLSGNIGKLTYSEFSTSTNLLENSCTAATASFFRCSMKVLLVSINFIKKKKRFKKQQQRKNGLTS